MDVFPAFIPLRGERVAVVGDGEAAEAKARLFDGSPAEVVRVAPARSADPDAYAGTRIVFIALGDVEAERTAAAAARAPGRLVNVVDRPELCDFNTPAIIDRSPVVAAVGTGGAAPMFATLLRNQIEARWPERLGELAAVMGELQEDVRAALPGLPARRAYWRRVMQGPAAQAAFAGDRDGARRIARGELERGPAAGRVWLLAAPQSPERLTLAAVRAFGSADRVVASGEVAAEVLAFARRDAHRAEAADAPTLAGWARAGEAVLVVAAAFEPSLLAGLQAAGVATEVLPTA